MYGIFTFFFFEFYLPFSCINSWQNHFIANLRHIISLGLSLMWFSNTGAPSVQDLMPDDLGWSWWNNNRYKVHDKCYVLESSRNHPPPSFLPPVRGKIVFHEIIPRCQKGWGTTALTDGNFKFSITIWLLSYSAKLILLRTIYVSGHIKFSPVISKKTFNGLIWIWSKQIHILNLSQVLWIFFYKSFFCPTFYSMSWVCGRN